MQTLEDFLVLNKHKQLTLLAERIPHTIRKRIKLNEHNCWLWIGATTGLAPARYPTLYEEITRRGKRRISPLKKIVKILGFNFVGHASRLCTNTLCVNPWHCRFPRYSILCSKGHIRNKQNTEVKKNGTKICKVCRSNNRKERRKATKSATTTL